MGKLFLKAGNIVSDELLALADAIVLPTNPMMRCGGGVSGAIFHKAGVIELEEYTETTFGISYEDTTRRNEMHPSEVRVTPGFALPCDIIFAQGPSAYEYADWADALALLLKTYENVLSTACKNGYKSILLPALGTGSYGFTHEKTAAFIIPFLKNLVEAASVDIYFVLYDEDILKLYLDFI